MHTLGAFWCVTYTQGKKNATSSAPLKQMKGVWWGTTKTRTGVGKYFVPLNQMDEGHQVTWLKKKRLIMIKWGFIKSFQPGG